MQRGQALPQRTWRLQQRWDNGVAPREALQATRDAAWQCAVLLRGRALQSAGCGRNGACLSLPSVVRAVQGSDSSQSGVTAARPDAASRPLPGPDRIGDQRHSGTMAKRVQTPLVCHGHTRPIVELNYSCAACF